MRPTQRRPQVTFKLDFAGGRAKYGRNVCYGFYTHDDRPSGMGERYRATVSGPGVTPDVMWQADAPGPYVRKRDLAANRRIRSLRDPRCAPN